MEKLTFTLKQHTPMLHFQASQQGATLRASDVKPRFDRWLVQTAFNGKFEDCKEYLVGYDPKKPNELRDKFNAGFRALNYKMHIKVIPDGGSYYGATHIENNKGRKVSVYPMYFGEEKGTVLKNCQVSFIIPDVVKDLYGYFCDLFSEFINCHNFGTRASKGYGSYTVISSNSVKANIDKFPQYNITLAGNSWEDIEKKIDLFYKTIRSGINYTQVIRDKVTKSVLKDKDGNVQKTGYYFKSLLFSYVEENTERGHWDKRIIKNHFLNGKHKNIVSKKDYRDCLGLSTNEAWMKYNMTLSKEISNVARYTSPIIFKPVYNGDHNWVVYIIIKEIPKGYMGKSVKVTAKKMNGDKDTRLLVRDFENKELTMCIAKDFSIKDYFKYICSQKITRGNFDIYKLVRNQEKEITDIINFYQQLKNIKF